MQTDSGCWRDPSRCRKAGQPTILRGRAACSCSRKSVQCNVRDVRPHSGVPVGIRLPAHDGAKSRVNQGAWVLDASTSFQPDAACKSELMIWILSDNVVKRKRSQVCLEPAAFSRRLAAAQSFQRSSSKQRMTSPVCAHAHQCQRAPVTVAIPVAALSSNLRGCFALPQANTKTLNARGRQAAGHFASRPIS